MFALSSTFKLSSDHFIQFGSFNDLAGPKQGTNTRLVKGSKRSYQNVFLTIKGGSYRGVCWCLLSPVGYLCLYLQCTYRNVRGILISDIPVISMVLLQRIMLDAQEKSLCRIMFLCLFSMDYVCFEDVKIGEIFFTIHFITALFFWNAKQGQLFQQSRTLRDVSKASVPFIYNCILRNICIFQK